MKLKKINLLTSLLALGMCFSTACSFDLFKKGNKSDPNALQVAEVSGAKAFVKQKYFNFTTNKPISMLTASNGYSNNGAFGSTWSSNEAAYVENEGLNLNISFTDNLSEIKSDSKDPFLSAEVRTESYFKYGYFGAYMKPSGVIGTASTFFLYSGNPHDEIDIEFLGRYHNKVQFNYFKNGVGGHEYWYELGFDATKEFHHYGIYWGEQEITWYVDYQPVYRLVGNETPSAECQLICNAWVGSSLDRGVIGWMGEANPEDFPTKSTYQKFEIADKRGNQIEKRPTAKEYERPLTDDDFVSAKGTLKEDSSNPYQLVSSSDNEFEFQWVKEALTKNYLNRKIDFEGIDDKCYARVTITNLSTDHPTLVRINMDSSGASGTTSSLLLSLLKNGRADSGQTKIGSNTEGIFEINAGETALCQLEWYGSGVNEMTFMFDDFGDMPVNNGVGQRDGHVIVKDFKFAGTQQFEGPVKEEIVEELYDVYDDPAHQVDIPSDYRKVEMSFSNVNKENTTITATNVSEGIQFDYSVGADNYDGIYSSKNGLQKVVSVIYVIKNNNQKAETYRFAIRYKNASGEKLYAVKSATILSDYSTGLVASLKEGKSNITVNGGRTCQFQLDFVSEINAYDFCIIPAIAASQSSGQFIMLGSYVRLSEKALEDETKYDANGQVEIPEGYSKVNPKFSSNEDSTSSYVVSETSDGILINYSVQASNYTGCYTSYHGIVDATSAIFVIKNLNSSSVSYRLGMRYKVSDSEKVYAITTAEFLSSPETGNIKSLDSGKLTVNIMAGKTAQILVNFPSAITLYDCMIAPSYGSSSASSGQFLVAGIYKK